MRPTKRMSGRWYCRRSVAASRKTVSVGVQGARSIPKGITAHLARIGCSSEA